MKAVFGRMAASGAMVALLLWISGPLVGMVLISLRGAHSMRTFTERNPEVKIIKVEQQMLPRYGNNSSLNAFPIWAIEVEGVTTGERETILQDPIVLDMPIIPKVGEIWRIRLDEKWRLQMERLKSKDEPGGS